jgi:hypothetical protein
VPLRRLVEGVLLVVEATAEEYLPKYRHLLQALARWDLLNSPDDFAHLSRGKLGSARPRLHGISITGKASAEPPLVWLVQPEPANGSHTISFDEVARLIETHADPFSREFAARIRAWIAAPGL